MEEALKLKMAHLIKETGWSLDEVKRMDAPEFFEWYEVFQAYTAAQNHIRSRGR